MDAAPVSPEALLAQADFVSALARRLLRDAPLAEDVAQDALATALARPPRSAASLRAWLARVTRNRARQAVRGEGARAARERASARPEIVAGPEGLLEREAARAAVVRELLAVPEPSRTALVLHYYEGRSARAIAAQLGVPVETVRTRVRRGLARMRERLAACEELRERGWMRALAPLAAAGSRPIPLLERAADASAAARAGTGASASGAASAKGAAVAESARLAPALLASLGPKLAALGALVLALVTWRWIADPGGAAPELPLAPLVAQRDRSEPGPAPAALDSAPLPGAAARRPGRAPAAPPGDTEASSAAEGPAATPAPVVRVELRARLVRPDGEAVEVEGGELRLRGARGGERTVALAGVSEVLVADLEPDLWTARVVTPGLAHRERVLDLSEPRAGEVLEETDGAPTRARFDERLWLWPEGWIAVVVRTSDDRPAAVIAADLGVEPKRVLYRAFEARARYDAPGADGRSAAEPAAVPLARFRPPPSYPSWELPGSVVASLELLAPPPMWIELAVHGVPLGAELLRPGEREIVFRLDAATFARGFGRVTLRLVDAPGGAPVTDARVTLKADTSPHRRADLANVAPDPQGEILLERVLPGRYELAAEGGGALHQARLELSPAEERDLGEIVLAPAAGVPLRVVDAEGRPARAWIEIAPYRPGEAEGELYPPNLHRHTDGDGAFALPLPSVRSIVRATGMIPPHGHPTDDRTPSVLLDPERPPLEPLRLALAEPLEVRFDTPPRAGAVIEVRDALELVVARGAADDGGGRRCELVPGRYRARVVDATGELLGETAFDLTDAALTVPLP